MLGGYENEVTHRDDVIECDGCIEGTVLDVRPQFFKQFTKESEIRPGTDNLRR